MDKLADSANTRSPPASNWIPGPSTPDVRYRARVVFSCHDATAFITNNKGLININERPLVQRGGHERQAFGVSMGLRNLHQSYILSYRKSGGPLLALTEWAGKLVH